ncbi:MAG: hypothetical protein NC389_17135 [Acetatifactor muris]|nr:hypothetical protein [Acetatifactor muris]
MTREKLEAYRSMQEEIQELKGRIQNLLEGDTMIDNSVINDYRSGYPVPQAVVGVDWEKIGRLRKQYTNRIAKLQKECSQVEEYIEGIEDSMTRRIFRMRFIDGLSQRQISRAVHFDKSTIGRKIDKFLKVAPKAPNAPL